MPSVPKHDLALVHAAAARGAVEWGYRNSIQEVVYELHVSEGQAQTFICDTIAELRPEHHYGIAIRVGPPWPDEYLIRRQGIGWYIKLALTSNATKIYVYSFHRSRAG